MARRPSTDAKKTVNAGAPVNDSPALPASKPDTVADHIMREAAKNGASLNSIAEMLQAKGCGHFCPTTISRKPAYREGRAQNPNLAPIRPWSESERDIVRQGAARGLSGSAIRDLLSEKGFDRGASNIAASSHFKAGRLAAKELIEQAALLAEPAPAIASASDRTVSLEPRIVRRFNGVSLPFVAIQKDWGEVIAR